MIPTEKKSNIIDEKNAISLLFIDIFFFQRSSKSYSPILQILDYPGSILFFQGNQGKNSIKNTYWKGGNYVKM
jgi:hypothetical protein